MLQREVLHDCLDRRLHADLRDGHERPEHSRTFLNRSWPPRQTRGRPSKPSQGSNRSIGHGRPIPSRSQRTERRGVHAPHGTGACRDRGRPGPRRVRTSSRTPGPPRASAITTGYKNRRSHSIHHNDLRRRTVSGRVRAPHLNSCRGPTYGPFQRGKWSTWTGLTLRLSL